MATCPGGHASQSGDFCDVCGTAMGAAAAPSGGPGPHGGTPCPDCGLPGTDRFCEGCGYDFVAGGGRPTPRTEWTAVVAADREYFNAVLAEEGPDSGSLVFPPYAPERSIVLAAGQVRIGRRSSTQPEPPEIDLREPPEDPGVSKVHAVLLGKPDGSWTLVDPGSTNRTYLNGSMDPIPLNTEIALAAGDRIHVGAWTTITLTRGETS